MSTLREEAREKDGSVTLVTKAFDAARRSWHLKVDIDKNEYMSLWLVERGQPIGENLLNQNITVPNFSSVILEFEVNHKSIGEKQTPIFFSFAHNMNQIIGHKKMLNL